MPAEFTTRIDALAQDRERGSSAIVADAADALADATATGSVSPPTPDTIRQALITFRHGQPAMAQVLRFCAETWAVLDHAGSDPISAVHEIATRWVTQLAEITMATAGSYVMIEPARLPVMTYSTSSAVIAALTNDHHPPGEIWLSNALPGGEGRATADRLAEHGWTVHLLSDAHLFDRAAAQPHRLLLGADAVTPTRFLNKIGSGALARLTAAAGGEVILCAGPEKALGDDEAAELVIPGLDDDSRVPLFGWGDLADVTTYIFGDGYTESGPGQAPKVDPAPLNLPDALRVRR